MGLTLLTATTLSACGGSSGTYNPGTDREDFLSRILPSGDSPGEWNYIWGCDVLSRSGNYTYKGVPLRFYRDGQLQAGIGSSTVLGTWKLDTIQQPWAIASVLMTLDEVTPLMFGTVSKKLLIDIQRNSDNDSYIRSNGSNRLADDLEDTAEIKLTCVRYDKVGDVVGDLPEELQSFEQTPSFIATGEANVQFVPTNPSTSDQETETTPPSDQPTPTVPGGGGSSSNDVPLFDITRQIKDIWFTNDFIDTVDGVRQRYGTVIEFDNGEVSRDGETISNEGIAASKRKNPKDWGEGRVSSAGLLSYKWSNSRSWLEPYLSVPTRSYPRNQKIRGCFENSTGVKGSGSSPLIKRLCLVEDGSFRLDDTENNTGNYLVEDHAIRLNFSSGERTEFLFGGYYKDGFIYRLIIADAVFYATR